MERLVKIILYSMAAPFGIVMIVLLAPAFLAGMYLDDTPISWVVALAAELMWALILFTLLVGLGVIK